MTYQIIQNDILNWAKEYRGEPYHAIFCDPPYHLTSITKRFGKPGSAPAKGGVYRRSSAGFMGMRWDSDENGGIAFRPETWAALSQHLHPGGFILAFAGTRGYHRMACAMEDSGLVLHPALVWVFCQGFPKSTSIANQIDRAAGVKGEVIRPRTYELKNDGGYSGGLNTTKPRSESSEIIAPATPLAQTWAGHRYGLQALKPALEFLAVAQVPYSGKPVDCITRTGAGAWNIDAGRIPTGNGDDYGRSPNRADGTRSTERGYSWGEGLAEDEGIANDLGRWPANLLLSEEGAALLDAQSGESVSRQSMRGVGLTNSQVYGNGQPDFDTERGYNDSGGASRMFFQSHWQYEILEQLENADPLRYEPKVSTAERSAGLDEPNPHPTLKPISLTKYLAGLLLPPDAYAPRRLLCPFSGTGSEMIGAILAGWDEVTGIEKTPAYIPVAEKRLKWWSQWPGWGQTDVDKILASLGEEAPAEQLSLFEA